MTTARDWLVSEAYPDGRNLAARRSIYTYRRPQADLPALAVEQLRGSGGLVVDVGCGDGAYVRALRAARSGTHRPGRGSFARHGGRDRASPRCIGDATRLPVATGRPARRWRCICCTTCLGPEVAIAELARVRAEMDVVLVATNAAADKTELFALRSAAIEDVTGSAPGWPPDGQSTFTLEAGEVMARRHFDQVRRLDFVGEVVLTEPEPLVKFIASSMSYFPAVPAQPLLDRVRARTAAAIRATGAFRFHSHAGFLVCR